MINRTIDVNAILKGEISKKMHRGTLKGKQEASEEVPERHSRIMSLSLKANAYKVCLGSMGV